MARKTKKQECEHEWEDVGRLEATNTYDEILGGNLIEQDVIIQQCTICNKERIITECLNTDVTHDLKNTMLDLVRDHPDLERL
jgi:hypothetical protein